MLSEIPLAAVDRIIRKAGQEKDRELRVSEEGVKALAAILIEHGIRLSREAIRAAEHAGRKTVKKIDLEYLLKKQIRDKSSEIPSAPVKRLMMSTGNSRVSIQAAEGMAAVLENYGDLIAKEAVYLADHSGRVTIKDTDIITAKEKLEL